jgi:lipopolysaccharide/colanic/teichoic acid biosynthesis glycosyltransferase
MTLTKRLFDLTLLALLGTILVPVLGILAVILAIRQGRPIFFGSERSKAPGRNFTLWKLRSMTHDLGDAGVSGGDKQQRITPMGRLLRRSRMDELPQMWNILRGDISFVGPRPPLPDYVARFPDLYAQVLQSRPGVTGLASLVFAAHEEAMLARCATPAETDATYARRCVPRKAKIDLIYQRNHSLMLDLWLVIITGGRAFGVIKRSPSLPRLRRRKRDAVKSGGRMSTSAGGVNSSFGRDASRMLSLKPNQQDPKAP